MLFGTSGHRGSALDAAFNDSHIAAITQAIVEYRAAQGVTGPLFLGRDTHALSEPAWTTALEVLAANDVTAMIDSRDRYTPTPAVSHAILRYNRAAPSAQADGIVVTPSHNPPRDGGFKYNPPNGGPADTTPPMRSPRAPTSCCAAGLDGVKRVPFATAIASVPEVRLPRPLHRRPAERRRPGRHPRRRRADRRRPSRRRERRLLGCDR